jgi:hypothetical protein
VFEDFILQKQNEVRYYSTRSSHKGIGAFYLSHRFSKFPQQLLRDNTNFLCLFRQDNTSLKHVYDESVGRDVSFDSTATAAMRTTVFPSST